MYRWLCSRTITRVLLTGLGLGLAVGTPAYGDPNEESPQAQRRYKKSPRPPLDPLSPWPKFRHDAFQTGRSEVWPMRWRRRVWEFRTGKGIFSSPVIDGRDRVYVGSADRFFYAIRPNGREVWRFRTGQIIDSSALLDDQGRVYFGSGDGNLYALDRSTGEVDWTFTAEPPSQTGGLIDWFEGNVGMRGDGALIAPNGNHRTYAVDRDTGEMIWSFATSDQTWSLPAYNPDTDRLFMGNNFFFLQNTFAIDASDGSQLWFKGDALGTVAASPLLTSREGDGLIVVGGFDGILRSYRQDTGEARWTFETRDHIYASPAQAADGTIIQPSGDGTIYAVDPGDGSLIWSYDTREPIRSSPAIDARGNIYVGSGEGRLFVLNPDGTLRWSIQLIDGPRNDLNASPALGRSLIAIAGENGSVFGVPYDYCLRRRRDPRCRLEPIPLGVRLAVTDQFGTPRFKAPEPIDANQPLTFSLFVRRGGSTELALIDSTSVEVTTSSGQAVATVAGDRRFITLIPAGAWVEPGGGELTVRIRGDFLDGFMRVGLRFIGGTVGGSFDETFRFRVRPRDPLAFPLPVAAAPGEDTGALELYRLATPMPTILPSYNQIGFDSIQYLIGMVRKNEDGTIVAWGIGGSTDDRGNTVVDPASRVRFPLSLSFDRGAFTMINNEGFTIEFNGFPLPFDYFRIAGQLDAEGRAVGSPFLNARAICGEIDTYGVFLQSLGICNPDNDLLEVAGGGEMRLFEGGVVGAPAGVGDVSFRLENSRVTATFVDTELAAGAHNFGVLVVDRTTGVAIPLLYTNATSTTADTSGKIATVSIDVSTAPEVMARPDDMQVYLMVDLYPAATASLPPGRAERSGASAAHHEMG